MHELGVQQPPPKNKKIQQHTNNKTDITIQQNKHGCATQTWVCSSLRQPRPCPPAAADLRVRAAGHRGLGEHKPGRIKPGRIKRPALSLQNHNYYMFCSLIRPRLYASERRGSLSLSLTGFQTGSGQRVFSQKGHTSTHLSSKYNSRLWHKGPGGRGRIE